MEESTNNECGSVSEFIEKLPPLRLNGDRTIFYRGQSDYSYDLKPSVLRDTLDVKRSERENEIYLSVLSECSNEFASYKCILYMEGEDYGKDIWRFKRKAS